MISLLLPALAALPAANAWGDVGHETIAYIAQNFVNSNTAAWAQQILGDTSSSYLANVATWADDFRYTSEGAWSEPFHFIDAEDSPPSNCNVDYDRDCGSTGCSVSAIANYTTQLQTSSTSAEEVYIALKFVIHLVGDITQPLHDENYEYGCNDVYVTFDKESTNLHHIWDTNMPELLRGGSEESTAQSWAQNLTTMINSGSYSSQKSSWLNGLNINDPVSTAMAWATDANAYVCSTVMPNGAKALEDESDLYPTYYNSVIDTLELQIAKAGYRLAAWLDAIYADGGSSDNDAGSNGEGGAYSGSSGGYSGSSYRRMKRDEELLMRSFMPAPRELSPAKMARMARGYGCNHKH